jgi:Putative MetA-pathway of phenol degradation
MPDTHFSQGSLRLLLVICALFTAVPALAQDNYEIQVYGSELVPSHATMVEVHSNFAGSGRKVVDDGVLPTNHAIHETLEVTHGFSEWFECGFYLFTSARSGEGYQFVGTHVRPRFAVPGRYHWPVGVSLSQEIGYQRREFSAETWSWEIRPIVDQQLGRLYWSFNPTLERALAGEGTHAGFEFAPNAMATYELTKRLTAGLEYYGGFGPITDLEPWNAGAQQLFPAINIDFGPQWEFNAGIGFGLTDSADKLLFKVIVGHRFGRLPPPTGHDVPGPSSLVQRPWSLVARP